MELQDWWREVWSVGEGRSRIYCGIARTPDGYAVDVFAGDNCIESETFGTRIEAAYAVDIFRRRHGRQPSEEAETFVAGSTGLAASGRS